jgi:hypothetical protein
MSRFLTLVVASLIAPACADRPGDSLAPVPGEPSAATRADLLGTHVCRATGGSDAKFRWDFREADFTMTGDGGAIPPEVVAAVAGRKDETTRIDGAWRLDGPSLVLTGLRVRGAGDREEAAPDATLAPFCTPVVRFEFGPTQYVLGPAN